MSWRTVASKEITKEAINKFQTPFGNIFKILYNEKREEKI